MLFDRLRRPPSGAPKTAPSVETKASAAARLVNMASATQAAWSPRDTATLTRSGFAANPVGFRAVKLIAEAAAALPLTLQDSTRRYDSHPMLSLITRPNTAQGRAEFLEALYGHLLLSGNAYVEAAVFGEDLPGELHVLRSDRMRVVPGSDGWPQAYEYAVGGRKHRFAATSVISPICHIRNFHPQDDHYGFSPLQAAAMAVDVHNSASRWSKSLLDNAARPSGALVWNGSDALGTLSEEQFRRLSDEIAESFQGARNAGRPMVLEGGLDWKPMGFSPSDMEFQATKESAAREIALAFGVPPMLMGLKGDATYANYQEANRAFYRLTVLPLAARVTADLSDWLSRYLGTPLTLAPDLDQVPALAAEREAQWRRISDADFLSDSEKRHLLGLPPKMQEQADG